MTTTDTATITLLLYLSGPAHQLREHAHIANPDDHRLTLCGFDATRDTWRWRALPGQAPTFGLLNSCCEACGKVYRAK
jgi:hypothetical protein